MRVAMNLTFAASKKEPLAEMIDRIRQVFLDAGLGEPVIRFTLHDSPRATTSPIDRVMKRYPEMERFQAFRVLIPGDNKESRLLTNAETGEAADYSTIQEIAA